MSSIRVAAMQELFTRRPIVVNPPSEKVSDYFGTDTFGLETMKRYLPSGAFENVKKAIDTWGHIDRKDADAVASAMKAWAMERGATHYTHWFHPLNGSTAEKHDAFFEPTKDGKVFEHFSGKELIQQEPDASSLPSGGIRNTFEARGYTAWDPSSTAFIVDRTLCIPTVFVSYTGDALDYKAPLLKSLFALDQAAVEVCHYFNRNVNKVISTLGWEQEYFLVDEALYYARPDLVLTDRTLMGHASAKDQQLADHYFGSIPERVSAFMKDLEYDCYRLGIPIRTRHNEVAPNQYECAPVFEEANQAVDHNQLLMDVMKRVARKHHFRALLHEKPYKGINGSGKHNNWSMLTNTGTNLLAPGTTPKTNLQFLTFLINTIKAVHDHADLLRASVISAGNEYRLGGNEAPPAIISVFVGKHLTKVLHDLERKIPTKRMTPNEKTELKLDIGKIPEILMDNTDRNRTSPFAFTGNRFEFRAVGSSMNCAAPMTVLNVAVANQLAEFKTDVDALIENGMRKDEAIFRTLRDYIIHSKKILFEGNGYSEEWKQEASRRGLTNISEATEALKAYLTPSSVDLLTKYHILSEKELHARYEIRLENYTKKIQIEARVLGDLAVNHIIPTVIKYQNCLIDNVKGLREVLPTSEFGDAAGYQLNSIKKISKHKSLILEMVDEMINARKVANKIEDIRKRAEYYSQNVKPFLDEIRRHIDKLELIVDDELWPLPKYRELIFTR
ncbi:MAG: glutamine synthetase III [Bacteroidales bacterium]|nr:glutamine synthetase III [Bacteroidales bacterium]